MLKLISLLIVLMFVGCRNETHLPPSYSYAGSYGVYFERDNKDSIFCVFHKGSYIRFRSVDGYIYTYHSDNDKIIDSLKRVIDSLSWHHVDTIIMGKLWDTVLVWRDGKGIYDTPTTHGFHVRIKH
jgi:hypothetical protein